MARKTPFETSRIEEARRGARAGHARCSVHRMEIVIRVTACHERPTHIEDIDYREVAAMALNAVRDLPIGRHADQEWTLDPIRSVIRPDREWGSQVHLRSSEFGQVAGACHRAGSSELTDTLAFVTCSHCAGSREYQSAERAIYGERARSPTKRADDCQLFPMTFASKP
jgi:hypothetical protein